MKTIKLAYIGFGVLGKQIEHLLKSTDITVEETLIFDDIEAEKNTENTLPFNEYAQKIPQDYHVCVALGYKHLKLKQTIQQQLKKQGNQLLTILHASCFVDETATIEEGVILYPNCTIDAGVTIKSGTLLNNSVTISHDSEIGECCYLSPGVVTSGRVTIGERSFLGTGVLVSNDITIGEDTRIGIGSVITKNVPPKTSGIGNPFIQKNIQL